MSMLRAATRVAAGASVIAALTAGPVAARVAAQRGGSPAFASPQVGADRTITLRLYAPHAKSVTANGELDGKSHPLTKAENGVWSVTIGPLAPDIYTYAFNVDGVTALDPTNANIKYGYGIFGAVNVVQMPGDRPQFYDLQGVPHGKVSIVPYESKVMEDLSRTAWIYTPPGYERGKDYPVLYLLHGAGDIESGWTMIGRANHILDNAIAAGRAKPMVVVMPLGHAIRSFWNGPAGSHPIDDVAKVMRGGGSLDEIITAMMAGDGKGGPSTVAIDIMSGVRSLVEREFKVSKRAEDRAIAGLSMGGGQAINIAFSQPESFRYVVLMSPAANARVADIYAQHMKNPAVLNKQFKLFWVGVGRDDTLTGPGDRAFAETLKKHGINHVFKETEGRHEWTVWRHHLNEVIALLFK
jgi:enterochelin esterase-like enzyme